MSTTSRHATRRTRWGSRAALAALGAAFLLTVPGTPWARGEYRIVADGYTQWEWAVGRSAEDIQLTDAVVRPDGWMIVGTWSDLYLGGSDYDGYLHLIPPWGEIIDSSNRFGPTRIGFRQLEIRQGKLYGLAHDVDGEYERPERRSIAKLYELDINTGVIVRELGDWWNTGLAVDPRTHDLVLQDQMQREPFSHNLVRFNPDAGEKTILVRDNDARSDDPMEVAYSPDGEFLYTAHLTGTSLDVRLSNGTSLYTIQSGQLDSMVHGRPGTCFEGMLVMTSFDGSAKGIRPTPNAAPFSLAQGGRAFAVSHATLARDGNVLSPRLLDVTLLACEGFRPPLRPPEVPQVKPQQVAAAQAAPQTRADVPPPAPGRPAPPPPPGQPPQGPPLAAPGPGVPPGHAPAVTTGVQPAVADAPDEQPVLGLSASARRDAVPTAWMRLSLGALLTLALASGAWSLIPRRGERIAPSRQESGDTHR